MGEQNSSGVSASMEQTLQAVKVPFADIARFRPLFLQETNVQIRYNARHERGWSDSYLLRVGDDAIGYGAVHGKERLTDRDSIFEFYVVPTYRAWAGRAFAALLAASGAAHVEAQSNDPLLASMLYEFTTDVHAPVILFADHAVTTLDLPGVTFRARRADDEFFAHTTEGVGDYVLEEAGVVVATGGFTLHYNEPFADLYMEVSPSCRRRGLGSLLLQHVKRECYLAGRVPAARCRRENTASRATLLKAGCRVAGVLLAGRVRPTRD
jgi:GNAT superfamily N-acetyltransferase